MNFIVENLGNILNSNNFYLDLELFMKDDINDAISMNSYIIMTMNTREGRNYDFTISNLYPKLIHKLRYLEIVFPFFENDFIVEALLCKVNGACVDKVCYISDKLESGRQNVSPTTRIIHNLPAGTDRFRCYINTLIDTSKRDFAVEYSFKVFLIINKIRREVYSHIFQPIRSHKYESSEKGKTQNSINCTAIGISRKSFENMSF